MRGGIHVTRVQPLVRDYLFLPFQMIFLTCGNIYIFLLYTCVALIAQFWLLCNYFLITYLCILSIYQNHYCLLLKLISSMHALTDFFLKRDAKEKAFISRKMNASVRESEKTKINDEIDWTKLIREMRYKICTYPILTCI